MRFKIDPEIVRLVAAITAGVQALGTMAGLTDVIGPKFAFAIVGLGVMLQAMLLSYSQGHATDPYEPARPSVEVETAPAPATPTALAPSTYASGRATVADTSVWPDSDPAP